MMMPIVLVTGFLGSGKTSLLRHWSSRLSHRRLAFLVNECGDIDIDGRLLAKNGSDVMTVAGGSIFCRCRTSDFIEAMRSLISTREGQAKKLDGVIIEASGIADPSAARSMMEDSRLNDVYELRSVVCVLEPASFLKLLKTLPNIHNQVASADVILVNKCDLCDKGVVCEAENAVQKINSRAKLFRTIHSAVPFDPFEQGLRAAASDGIGRPGLQSPHFDVVALTFDKPIDEPAKLGDVLNLAGDELYRAKGFIADKSELFHAEWSSSGWEATPVSSYEGPLFMVFVLRGSEHPKADLMIKELRRVAARA